jgi:hypothetical protein
MIIPVEIKFRIPKYYHVFNRANNDDDDNNNNNNKGKAIPVTGCGGP